LLSTAIVFTQASSERIDTPALPQNQFLIDAVVETGTTAPPVKSDPFKVRTLWMLDLFETLRERDRNARVARLR